jgi:Cu+-exporting ATPase
MSTVQTHLTVRGMTCGHCEKRVAAALSALPGVQSATASAGQQRADVIHAGDVSLAALTAAVVAAGYEAEGGESAAAESADSDPAEDGLRPASLQATSLQAGPNQNPAPVDTPEPLQAELTITGMTCSACVGTVERQLLAIPGVQSATVNLLQHRGIVRYQPLQTGPRALAAAVTAAGYPTTLPSTQLWHERLLQEPPPSPMALLPMIGALLAGVVLMALGMPLMHDSGAHVHGTVDPLTQLAMQADGWLQQVWPALYQWDHHTLRLWSWLLATLVLVGAGRGFFVRAWQAARHRSADMNTLVALGTGAAYLASLPATWLPDWLQAHQLPAETWYEAVPWVTGFVLLGQWLDDRAKHQTTAALRRLAQLQVDRARIRQPDGSVAEVALAEVLPGDVLMLGAGERVAVDAIMDSGAVATDESMLTGESIPQPRSVGARVLAGSLVVDGGGQAKVIAIGNDSTLAQIAKLTADAAASKPAIQSTADAVIRWFAPAVVMLAVVAALGWWLLGPEPAGPLAIRALLTVLVVACPCALGLAVPAALAVATGRAAQLGLLVRSARAIESGHKVTTIVLDKTGTLTTGQFAVTASQPVPSDLQPALATLLAGALHPLSKAVAKELGPAPTTPVPLVDLQSLPGLGLQAQWQGQLLRCGSVGWLSQTGVAVGSLQPAVHAADSTGQSLVAVALGNTVVGWYTLEDGLKPSAQEAVQQMQRLGLQIVLASGDRASAVQRVAAACGITDWHAEQKPSDKLNRIAALQQAGQVVAMVGDGSNDAPALAAANLGIAVGQGTDIAAAAADLVLLRDDLRLVPTAVALLRATQRVIRGNLFWAFAYNAVGLPLAAGLAYPFTGVLLTPAFASAAMALSSITVVLHALRLRWWQPGHG